jgi:hypothetical protein
MSGVILCLCFIGLIGIVLFMTYLLGHMDGRKEEREFWQDRHK